MKRYLKFELLLPLLAAFMTVAVAVLCSGVLYWLLSAVCVCVSLVLTFHILNRRQALPEALEHMGVRLIKLFKR